MNKINKSIEEVKKLSNILSHKQNKNVVNNNIFILEQIISQIKLKINVDLQLNKLNNDFFNNFNKDMCDCFLYLFSVERNNQVVRKKNIEILYQIMNIFYIIVNGLNNVMGYKIPVYEYNKCDGDLFIEDKIFEFFINECKDSDEGARYDFCVRFSRYKSLKEDLDKLYMSKNLKNYNYVQIFEKLDLIERFFFDIISDMFKYVFLNYKSYSNNKLMCVVTFADQQLQIFSQLRSEVTDLKLHKKPKASFNVLYN